MTSPVGMFSTKTNPVGAPKMTSQGVSSGSNPDRNKVSKMQKQAYNEKESLRGKSGF